MALFQSGETTVSASMLAVLVEAYGSCAARWPVEAPSLLTGVTTVVVLLAAVAVEGCHWSGQQIAPLTV
jgi:hypothetical protein